MKQRVESVDILRGFTIVAMILVNTPGTWSSVYAPFLHADWHGLTPTDLVFPFFLFIVGISISYAYKNKTRSKETYRKILIRSLKLIGLGLFLNWIIPYLPFFSEYETLRIPGVLQRIGIVFLISSFLFLNLNWKALLSVSLLVLIAYWIFLGFVPLPDGSVSTFDRAPNNWALYLDANLLGNHMWKPDYDPEGLISTIPSIITCLFGILIGKFLSSISNHKERILFLIAILFLVLGYLWSLVFPINKAIWSSSFVLVTAGWATLILSIIYYLTDVKAIKFGTIFKYVGMNAITIYFLSSFISKAFYLTKVNETENIHSWLYHHLFDLSFLSSQLSSLLYAISVSLFYLFLGFILYKKRIFIKV